MSHAFVRRFSACFLSSSVLVSIGVASPAMAVCYAAGADEICDDSYPNPSPFGASGDNIHLLTGSIVQVTDPFAFPGLVTTSVRLNANGTLVADLGSRALDTVAGGTAVEGGRGSTLSISGVVEARHNNSRAILLDAGSALTLTENGRIETDGDGSSFFNHSAAITVGGDGVSVDLAGLVWAHGVDAPAVVAGDYDPISIDFHFHDALITVESGGRIVTDGGNSSAILMGNATVANNGMIITNGNGSSAILQTGLDGTGTIVNNGTILTYGADAIGISATDPVRVRIGGTGSVATAASGASAIVASSAGDISIGQGGVYTSGEHALGIDAVSSGGAVAVSLDALSTTGNAATGIAATGATGVTVQAGSVSTTGATPDGQRSYGIYAFATDGPVSVTAGTVSTAGANAQAIYAASQTGDVSVDVGQASSTGGGAAAVSAIGLGATRVHVGDADALGGPAVQALGGGSATVTLDGAARSGNGPAIVVGSLGTATLTLGGAATLTQADGGAALYSPTSSVVNNAGTIVGDGSAPILTAGPPSALGYPGATAGALTFNNSGGFVGTIGFTAGDDVVTNSGTFEARFSQDFGAGNDSFNNGGRVTLGNTGSPISVTLAHLERFNNAGIVDLRNGVAGDQLTIPGAFNATGGSTLGLDVQTGTSGTTADVVHLGSVTGTTRIALALTGKAVFTGGATLVTVAAPADAGAFSLVPPSQNTGFVRYSLVYDAADLAFQLVGAPNAAAYQFGGFAQGAQQLWYKSADAVGAHMSAVRDAGGAASADAKGGAWLQLFGQSDTRADHATFQPVAGDPVVANLGFAQDSFGGQLGYDIGGIGENGGLLFGITGGYQNSRINLAGTDNHGEFDSVDIGAYGTFKAGPFFINGLAKYDHGWGHAGSVILGYSDRLKSESWGGQIDVGARFGGEGLFAEPIASIAYVRTSLDRLHALDTRFDFDSFNGLRGKAGLKVGGTTEMAGQAVTFYASGEAVHEFKGKADVTIADAGGAYAFRSARLPTYGKGTLGFSIASGARVSGFVEGFGDDGKDYRGGGGRAGISLKL